MADDKQTPYWLVWLAAHPYLLLTMCAVVLLAPIIALGMYVDSRIENIEQQIDYEPPANYKPPRPNVPAGERLAMADAAAGQQVYVPTYSHIYFGGGRPYSLEATLSIRNTDRAAAIMVNRVDYHDTSGKLVREYLEAPLRLESFETVDFVVEVADSTGGSGANFLVEWVAGQPVNPPIVETVMVGTMGAHGISFARSGVPIEARPDNP